MNTLVQPTSLGKSVYADTFGERLSAVFEQYGHLCVGIDPHPYVLEKWGMPDTAEGVYDFGCAVVEASHGVIGLVKPQVAFFERFGSAGFSALEKVIATARSAGLLVIADAKRGDIGSTVQAYGEAWLHPGAPLESDALTLATYQGVEALTPVFELAERYGKGVFVLAAMSNPEAVRIQTAQICTNVGAASDTGARTKAGTPVNTTTNAGTHAGLGINAGAHAKDVTSVSVARSVIDDIAMWNSEHEREPHHRKTDLQHSHNAPIASIGYVFGATINTDEFGINWEGVVPGSLRTPVLAPGFGHQGVSVDDARTVLGGRGQAAIISVSRSVLSVGKDAYTSVVKETAQKVMTLETPTPC